MSDGVSQPKKEYAIISSAYKSGWSYMGRTLLENLSDELQSKLKEVGSKTMVDKRDRWIQYVNRGLVTASSKKPVIDFYRRFKRRR